MSKILCILFILSINLSFSNVLSPSDVLSKVGNSGDEFVVHPNIKDCKELRELINQYPSAYSVYFSYNDGETKTWFYVGNFSEYRSKFTLSNRVWDDESKDWYYPDTTTFCDLKDNTDNVRLSVLQFPLSSLRGSIILTDGSASPKYMHKYIDTLFSKLTFYVRKSLRKVSSKVKSRIEDGDEPTQIYLDVN